MFEESLQLSHRVSDKVINQSVRHYIFAIFGSDPDPIGIWERPCVLLLLMYLILNLTDQMT